MTTADPIYGIDDLTNQMRRRGYVETEFVFDWDAAGNVLVRARYEPESEKAARERDRADFTPAPALTARDIARAQQHEQGVNTLKGGAVLFAGVGVAFLLLLGWFYITG